MKYTHKLDQIEALARARCTDLFGQQRGFELRVMREPDYLRVAVFLPSREDASRMEETLTCVTISPRPVPGSLGAGLFLRMDITVTICGEYRVLRSRMDALSSLHDLMRTIDIKIRDEVLSP